MHYPQGGLLSSFERSLIEFKYKEDIYLLMQSGDIHRVYKMEEHYKDIKYEDDIPEVRNLYKLNKFTIDEINSLAQLIIKRIVALTDGLE